ncbi:protection of telomeres protein 1b-like [Coffea arabica]|uniref:Protection of telomeres protein 1b-like n=1 Tax=Coffea arabica TaxID=13443 RepID=A0ABM4U802_COFAR|nr:protection of telomeres protein 1b-like [Coffea arabica]
MGRRDDYRFLQLIDAIASINQKVNLIGVVIETSIPKQSKGTDCFCTIRIVDESKPSPGIAINFFAENMEKLPQVMAAGDIIQLSHVVMKMHGSEVYAVFNKKFSSFALFEGKHGRSFVPYQFSATYHAREQDKKFILELRKWLIEHPNETGSQDLPSLKEIREGEHFNLACKILHLCEVKKDEWILFVWDGTDTPPALVEPKFEDEKEDPLPLQLEPFPLPRDVLCTFPAVGTVLRVIIRRGNEKLDLNVLKSGRWVKFVNLKCESHAALWCAFIMPFTKICYLPDDDDIILQRQRSYDERISSKWGRMPLSCFPWPSDLTETDHPDVPFVTLMHVLTNPEVTSKFRCVVRVVAVFPWRVEDFYSPVGAYRIRLTLEDATARIHAFLYADDAVNFFGGYYPVDVMTRKRNTLLGIPESDEGREMKDGFRNPSWMQCCLKSYYVDKGDPWGSRNYRMFATRLLN